MIIFGTRGVTYTKESSEFYCPNCAAQAPYKHKRVRRFFTLYFIPVIPMDLLGEYVECQRCGGTYQLKVLELDPGEAAKAFEAEFHRVMKRVMVLMMLADDVIEEEELDVVRGVYEQMTGRPLSKEDVMAEVEEARADGQGIDVYLPSIAGNLNDRGKESVVAAAFMVAAADGEFQEEERQLIGEIGSALDMTPAHLNGLVSELVNSASD